MKFRPGTKFRSAFSEAMVVVVRPYDGDEELECGGVPMVPEGETISEVQNPPEPSESVMVGKRYRDEPTGLEVLGARSGVGGLSLGGRALEMLATKKLPSSD